MKGIKYDKDKAQWDLLPYDIIEEVVDILTYGAKKYAPDNWKGVAPNRYESAMMRHFVAWKNGEEIDNETNMHHLSHAICNLVFLRWLEKNKKK